MPTREHQRKIFQENKSKTKLKKFFKFCLIAFLFCSIFIVFLFFYYGKELPRPERFNEKQLFQPTKIFDRTGEILLYQIYGEEKREIVPLEQIPEILQQSVIASEDANFYKHFGLDLKGITRAILNNLKIGSLSEGGSTITQQLIRSSLLTNEKTVERKIKEIILTLELERRVSKDQILEFYLNQVPFGSNCYGAQSASKTYFKKDISEITLPEAAILASLIQAPSYLSPYGENIEILLNRKNYIIDRLVKINYLEKEEAEEFKKIIVDFTPLKEINPFSAPFFVLEVKDYLFKNYGENYLKQNGLKVYTTLDWDLQSTAEQIIEENKERNESFSAFNSSLVSIDPNNGQILAMVGSRDYFGEAFPEGCKVSQNECFFSPQFNVAILGKRQPGSAFKPFVYSAAFDKGFTSKTILWDVKTNFGLGIDDYIPENYDQKNRGPVSLRQALSLSLNVPSVKLLYLVGIEESLNIAKKFGITTLTESPLYYGLPLVLGGGEVTLLEMTSAYGIFATEGYKISPSYILKIENNNGEIIQEFNKESKRIFKAESCKIINDILSDNLSRAPAFGLNSPLYFPNYQVAAKTGTTQKFSDAWTFGYTSSITTGVWVGNNNNSSTLQPGVVLAGPIFHKFMEKALEKYPPQKFSILDKIEEEKPILNGEIEEPYHSILYYIKKEDPLGEPPLIPENDPQFLRWEKGIEKYTNP